MAYVTVEDDTASIELLCFARVLESCGPYLKENQAVVVKGRLSVRDEKAPRSSATARIRSLPQALRRRKGRPRKRRIRCCT